MPVHLCESLERARSVARALSGPEAAAPVESETDVQVGNHRILWLTETGKCPFMDVEPREHGDLWHDWRLAELPLDPSVDRWRIKLKPLCPDLLTRLAPVLTSAETIYHHGRPSGVGQWSVDETLRQCGLDPAGAKRVWSDSAAPEELARATRNAGPNDRRRPLADAAEARRRADWLTRVNYTRLFTLLDRRAGGMQTYEVDRLATAALRLADGIESRRPAAKRAIVATFRHAGGAFEAETEPDGPDAEGEARAVLDVPGRIAAVAERSVETDRPKPFNGFDLTASAAARGIPAGCALAAAFKLYDMGLLTFPAGDRRQPSIFSPNLTWQTALWLNSKITTGSTTTPVNSSPAATS